MQLSEIFLGQGEPQFTDLLRGISIGKLKTYQLYDRMKVRLHLAKLNSENLRKAAPKFWTRLEEKDEEFAGELAQAILVSHLDMIKAVIDDLGIPNQEGFELLIPKSFKIVFCLYTNLNTCLLSPLSSISIASPSMKP